MSFENNNGLNVNNHYGARVVGGTEGVTKTSGVGNEWFHDLDGADTLYFGFPVTDGSAYVTEADVSLAGGSVTAISIGGVNVTSATPESPVLIPALNTGVVTLTGGDGTGKFMIGYKKYPL